MVGGCGRIGAGDPVDGVAEHLARTGEEVVSDFDDGRLAVTSLTHGHETGETPARTPSGDALVWVWGNVLGEQRAEGYRGRRADDDPAPAYCAARYAEDGLEFVKRLNGDFVGVVYDRDEATVSVFTDRLGTWPLYHATAEDGSVVFSAHLQSLAAYPGLTLKFDEPYVAQHLSWRGGPYGVKTVFRGVESFQPGSVTTHDLSDGSVTCERYWRPSFDPDEQFDDYDAFVDAFVDAFRASIADRTWDRSKRYGILMSGGSDARLVLGALPGDLDVVAYHMGDWMSKEARVAERIAMTRGIEFRFLRRDPDYFGRVLERSPSMWNYEQLFNQAWAEGFIDDIREEVDVLFTGHFSDTLFKETFVPVRYVDLGPLGNHPTPVELPIETVATFDEELGPRKPAFVDSTVDLSEVLERNISVESDRVEAYGVEFGSFREFVHTFAHFPATTDPMFRRSLREHVELQMPVYDNRLLDLWERMPVRFQLRRNVINAAVAAVAPDLADIPHASTGVSLHRSKLLHRLGRTPMNRLRELSPFDAVPAAHVNNHPWGNHEELLRTRSYVGDAIEDGEEVIRSLPFLDWDRVLECYEDHQGGENNMRLLHRLVTFVEAPLTREIAARYADAPVESASHAVPDAIDALD
jgi:asparagine synthase (glutamine-hydrolysing)